MKKQCLAFVLAVLMLTSAAHAAVIPELEALAALYNEGNALKLTLSADIIQWQALSQQTLPAIKAALDEMQAEVVFSRSATAASISRMGSILAGVRLDNLADGREAMTITPGGLCYIAPAGETVTGFLADETPSSSPMRAAEWLSVLNGARKTLPAILLPLDGYGKAVKRSITIKNVGTARSQVEYALSAQEWNALWPSVLHQLDQSLPFAKSVGTALHRQVLAYLKTLTFESKGSLKRYLNADGADMGWQFTGQVSRAGEGIRKVTLYGGINDDTGLYVSLKLPAVSGADNLSLQASFTWKERNDATSIAGDISLRTVFGSDSITERVKVNLKRAGEEPRLTGRIVWDSATGGTSKRKSVLTVEPDLLLKENSLTGTLDVEAKVQGAPAFSGRITASLSPGLMPEGPIAQRTVDLTQISLEQMDSERATLAGLIILPLWMYANQLPSAQRSSLLHDLSRDFRTQGDTVPVMDLPELGFPDTAAADDYVVDVEE